MSDQLETAEAGATENKAETKTDGKAGPIKLGGLFAFKVGMTQVVNSEGAMEACTVLRYEPWTVSQVKTKDNDGYEAVQIACRPRRESRSPKTQRAPF